MNTINDECIVEKLCNPVCGMTVKTANLLTNHGITNIGELRKLTPDKARTFRNCGIQTLWNIRDSLGRIGVNWGPELEQPRLYPTGDAGNQLRRAIAQCQRALDRINSRLTRIRESVK